MVIGDVHLSVVTSATLAVCYTCHTELPVLCTGGRRGRRQVSMSLTSGATHILQWSRQQVAKPRGRANPPKTAPQFGLKAAIRLHEAGIGSNRKSAGCGEYVLAPCTHCPSSQQSQQRPKRETVTLVERPFYGEVGDED
jgi:hypothetical protein